MFVHQCSSSLTHPSLTWSGSRSLPWLPWSRSVALPVQAGHTLAVAAATTVGVEAVVVVSFLAAAAAAATVGVEVVGVVSFLAAATLACIFVGMAGHVAVLDVMIAGDLAGAVVEIDVAVALTAAAYPARGTTVGAVVLAPPAAPTLSAKAGNCRAHQRVCPTAQCQGEGVGSVVGVGTELAQMDGLVRSPYQGTLLVVTGGKTHLRFLG